MKTAKPPFSLSGRKRLLTFHGRCLKVLPYCEGMCCRDWDIELSDKERKSGAFKMRVLCRLTDGNCASPALSCPNRLFMLQKNPDDSCLYLDSRSRCTIYKTRPAACRRFKCTGGWRLTASAKAMETRVYEKNAWHLNAALLCVGPKSRFKKNPDIALVGLYYFEKEGRLSFMTQAKGNDQPDVSSTVISGHRFGQKQVAGLVSLLVPENTLSQAIARFRKTYRTPITAREASAWAFLFHAHGIIVPVD
jgi:Fe-S-cluster containining protein